MEADQISQVPSSTSTLNPLSTSASTTILSTSAGTTVITTAITAGTVPSSSKSASSQSIMVKSLSGIAIAGIVVAIVAATLVLSGLLLCVWWRRRQQRHGLQADQAALAQQHERPLFTVMHEADNRHPQFEIGDSDDSPFEIGFSDEREGARSRAAEMPK